MDVRFRNAAQKENGHIYCLHEMLSRRNLFYLEERGAF